MQDALTEAAEASARPHLHQHAGKAPPPATLPAIEASFKGRGMWKKSLPRILEALGRARREGDGWQD